MNKPIVTDTYDFPTLIKRGYVYIPKTGDIELLSGPVKPEGGPVRRISGPVKLMEIIRTNPGLRKGDLSRLSGISERSIKRYLERLSSQVEFRGAPKNGGYYEKT